MGGEERELVECLLLAFLFHLLLLQGRERDRREFCEDVCMRGCLHG